MKIQITIKDLIAALNHLADTALNSAELDLKYSHPIGMINTIYLDGKADRLNAALADAFPEYYPEMEVGNDGLRAVVMPLSARVDQNRHEEIDIKSEAYGNYLKQERIRELREHPLTDAHRDHLLFLIADKLGVFK